MGANWRGLAAALAVLAVASSAGAQNDPPAGASAERPNIVLILIDDAGFTDLGAYGGEARTANIDALAQRGVRFSNYHSSPLCSPSRAMLLTGVDNHRTGVATIGEVIPPSQRGQPGYSLHLEPGVTTVASRLQASGYRTYMTGKWHLGDGPGQLPNSHGFDRSFALEASGADNWEQKPYMPYYAHADWYEDGAPATLPSDFYSSRFLVDQMIDYIDSEGSDARPFFAYVAFQAVHIPVQAPREDTARYRGRYDQGWTALREQRFRRAQELGLIPSEATMGAAPPNARDWQDVEPGERALLARSMEVHAGMLDSMDQNIGRLIAHLQEIGELENTVFVVTSDNGPEPSNPLAARGFEQWMHLNGYTRELDNLGERGSMVAIGPEFANATAGGGALFKFYTTEGGTRVPMIIAGPGVGAGLRADGFAYVTDIAPTLLELARVAPTLDGVPVTGRSLSAVLRGEAQSAYGPEEPVGLEVSGNAALFRGDFKLVINQRPNGDGQWRLYNVRLDPGETRDLSTAMPDLFAQMQREYEAYVQEMGVLAMPEGYNIHGQIETNTYARQFTRYMPFLIGGAVVLIGLLGWLVWLFTRKRRAKA
jgi:arylsulfatase/uncharacterized sulfatase